MVSAADRQLSLSVSPDTRMMHEAVNKCCHACTLHLWSNGVSMEHIYICFEFFLFLLGPGTTFFWVSWSWVNSLSAFSICNPTKQPADVRGKPHKHVAILKQYNIPCSFVLFCFSEQIKFVPGGTNLHLTQIIATFLFLLRFLFLWESAL